MDFNGSRDYHPTGGPCNSSADCEDYHREGAAAATAAAKILIPSIYAAVCCLGLSANTTLIYVTLRHVKTKSATHVYILNLALAQQLFMLGLPFLAASAALRRWPFGSLVCRLVLSLDALNMFTSVFCLTALSLDRYVAVVGPAGAARCRGPGVAGAVAAGVWGLSLLVVLPVPVFADTVPAPDGGADCNFVWPGAVWSEAFVLYTFLLGFLLPLGAMGLCLGLMGVRTPAAERRRRSEKRMTRLVLLLAAVFVLCWTPFYVVQLLSVFGQPPDPTLTQLCVVLSYANSAVNPLLCGLLSHDFRPSFRHAACFRRPESGPDAGSGGAYNTPRASAATATAV